MIGTGLVVAMDGGDYSSLSGQAPDYVPLRSGGSFSVPIEPFEVEHSKEASQSGRGSGLNSSDLMFGENRRWQPPADLDSFFQKVYLYYCEKGFLCMVTQVRFCHKNTSDVSSNPVQSCCTAVTPPSPFPLRVIMIRGG